MKKLHSLFILLILTSAVFVGCSPSTGNGVEAVETESKVNEYGFISSETYTVVFTNGSSTTMTGKALTNAAKDTGMVNGTDYTINDKTVTLTASGMTKMTSYLGNGGNSSGGDDTPTYTVSVPSENCTTSSGSSYKLVIKNAPIDGYKKGDPVEILITNGSSNVNTGWGTPEGLYLVKVKIEDKSTGNDIKNTVGLKIEDNKIKFTMPSNNVDVYASFEDVVFKDAMVDYNNYGIDEGSPFWNEIIITVLYSATNPFKVVMVFEDKDFDNLMSVDGKYVLYDKASYTENAMVSILSSYNLFNENTMTYKLGVDYGSKIISDDGITTKNLGGSGWLFTISIK